MIENIEEQLISHTNNMIMKEWISREFKQRNCNCNIANKDADGKCIFNRKCRTSCVIYELQCKISKTKCIGQTQQHLKDRTNQYLNDVLQLKNREIYSDSLVNHFVKFFKKKEVIRAKEVRNILEIRILMELEK